MRWLPWFVVVSLTKIILGIPVHLGLFFCMIINLENHQKNTPEAIVTVIVTRNSCLWVPIILGPVRGAGWRGAWIRPPY
jgi:hypothetical protein